jgi:hypothetical protein
MNDEPRMRNGNWKCLPFFFSVLGSSFIVFLIFGEGSKPLQGFATNPSCIDQGEGDYPGRTGCAVHSNFK